jgi:hypothetical protein
VVDAHTRNPRRRLFKKLEILPVPYQYIISFKNFTCDKKIQTNSSVHSIETRNKDNFQQTNFQPILFSEWCILFWYQNIQQFTT